MAKVHVLDITGDDLYRELVSEYKDLSPKSIETALLFIRVASQINVSREALFCRFGLTSGRYTILMMLRHEKTRSLLPSELAERSGVTRATMTQFVDALEKDEFVKREDHPDDRRAMQVKLTSQGEARLKEVLPEHLARLSHFTRILTMEEQSELLRLTEKLAMGLSEWPI